jgi:Signal transduction histidine kinase, nitrogen specific
LVQQEQLDPQKMPGGLAQSLVHKVKNLLSGIKGSGSILEKKYSDDFSKKILKNNC